MAFQAIPFGKTEASGYEELGGAPPRVINVVVDATGTITKRPGIATYASLPAGVVDPAGISGIYATNGSRVFVTSSGDPKTLYTVNSGTVATVGQISGPLLPTFTETEAYFLLATGAIIRKVKLDTLDMSDLGGDPPLASHVIANSSRLLANDVTVDKTKVRFSGVFQGTVDTSEMEDWTVTDNPQGGGFFTAEARPDNIVAVIDNTNEIYVWGVDNVQIFVPDATAIFAPAATREFGCLAPYSIVKRDQEFYWFDQYRRFVHSDGRTFDTFEAPIKNQLDALSTPTDCFGFRCVIGFVDTIVWVFPTDRVSFAFQVGGGWSQWSGYDDIIGNYIRMPISAGYLRRDGGGCLVGTTAGRLGVMSLDESTDLGARIVSQVTTGFLDRGSDNRKVCKSVKVTARRGLSSSQSFGRLEWRDDTGNWNGPLFIDFGQSPSYTFVQEFRSLGIYNRRQWRFTFSDSSRLSLVRVMEEFDILGV